jgi:lambda family phage tail tape measure protein
MADTTLTVAVDTAEALRSIEGLKTAIASLITGVAIKQLMDFSDGITNINNRLRAMSPDMETARTKFNAIAAIAMETGAPLKDVADTFAKLSVTTRDLGISQQQVANITSTLTKQLAINGTSSVESASAMYQFNQAMALGTFQGNDLHVLLQTMPAVMQGFADSIGQPIGNLKKLGETGSITSEMVIKYFTSIKDKTDETFGNMGTTFARSFETLKTASSVGFKNFESNTETGQKLAKSIEYIAVQIYLFSKNIDELIGPLSTLFKILSALVAFTVVGRMFAFITETVLIFTRAVFGLPGAIAAVGTKFMAMIEYVGTAGATFAGFGRVLTPLIGVLGSVATWVGSIAAGFMAWTGIDKFNEKVSELTDKNSATSKSFEEAKKAIYGQSQELDASTRKSLVEEEAKKKLAYAISLVALASRQQTEDLKINLDRTKEKLDFDAKQIIINGEFTNKSKDQIEVDTALRDLQFERADAVRKLTEEQQKLQAELKNPAVLPDAESVKLIKEKIGVIGQQIETEKRLYDEQAKALPAYIIQLQSAKMLEAARVKDTENMIKMIEDQIKRSHELGNELIKINDTKIDIKFETGEIGKGQLQRQFDKIVEDGRKAGLAASRAFAASFGEDELTPEKAQELADGLEQIRRGYEDITRAQTKNLEESRKWSTGWSEAFNNYQDEAGNAANQAKTLFDTATKGMEDAIVTFAMTGKLSFKSMADSIISDIVRILAKKAIMGAMSGGTTGILSGLAGLFGFASGGNVGRDQPIMIGEQGPEMFVPASNGTIIPNNKLNTGGGSPTNITYNIQAVDASSFRSMVARDPQFIYNITEVGRRSTPSRRLA